MQFNCSQRNLKMTLPAESCQADTQGTQLKLGLGEEESLDGPGGTAFIKLGQNARTMNQTELEIMGTIHTEWDKGLVIFKHDGYIITKMTNLTSSNYKEMKHQNILHKCKNS